MGKKELEERMSLERLLMYKIYKSRKPRMELCGTTEETNDFIGGMMTRYMQNLC